MQAVIIAEPGKVDIVTAEPETGSPAPGFVRVALIQGGICGSDLAAYLGTSPMVRYPRVIGHELVGEVVETGPDAAAWLGKRVVVEPMLPCGKCYPCRIGRYNACVDLKVMGVHVDGGLRGVFDVPVSNLYEVPEGISADAAVLAEPLTIALQAITRPKVSKGERVLIFGAGPIGLLVLQAAVAYIGAEAMVVDVRADRLEAAKRLGAGVVYDVSGWAGEGTDPGLIAAVREWTQGEMVHVAVEASGHPASMTAAVDCIAHCGRISMVGWNKGPIVVDTVQLMRKEADVYGSRNSTRMFPKALEVLAGGHIDVETMITHRMPLSDARAALELMKDPKSGAIKIVLRP